MAATGRLSGSTAIVTGASQGIGEAIAKTLAREGASVAIASRNLREAERVAAEIEAAGGMALVVHADVTQSQEVAAMVRTVLERWESVDILVNGVGGFHGFAPIQEIAEEEWDRIITLNLKTAFLCARAVVGTMIEQGNGRIINIGSQSGSAPNPQGPSFLPYAAAKAGLIGFTKHLAKQLAPYGITVNAISPGTTLTPRVMRVRGAEGVEKITAMNPMKRLLQPQDSAEAVLFLASDESRSITGVNLQVNAGAMIV